MKSIYAGVFCCALACAPAFAQAAGAAANPDQTFVDLAAQTDMTEAHLGQLAETHASSQAVKDYASMLVSDHTKDYSQLSMIATKAGLTVPKGLDAKHQKMVAPFEKLKGAAFDHKYVQQMVAGHTAASAAYEKESTAGQNADIKAYASQTLPALAKHKEAAQAIAKGGKHAS
jgi:putative membrane protein